MPRWEPDGFDRLQAAAFDLFDEQGFERTTVAEIARRAGLTQRTFFNHFADKREVLFGLSSGFQKQVEQVISTGATTLPPLDAIVHALHVVADAMFEERRAAVMRRHRIVEANPELRERELSKLAALTDAIAAALRARGHDADTALLTASVGMLVYRTAIQRWTRPEERRPLHTLFADALDSLRSTVNQQSGPPIDPVRIRPERTSSHTSIE